MGLLVSLVEATSLDPDLKKLLREFAEKIEFLESKQVTKKEFEELKALVYENTKAINQLTKQVDQLTQRVDQLAEAQLRTEQEIRKLSIGLRETRKMERGLSDAIGYTLEDRAIRYLPSLLKERFNIEVKGYLVRKFVEYNGITDELNIFGEGEREGEKLCILGEAKARLSKKNVDELLRTADRLLKYGVIKDRPFLLFVTYSAEPKVERYAREKGIEVIWSYMLGF